MRWRGRRQSQNVEDRRSVRNPVAAGGGILTLIIVIIIIIMGGDPAPLIQDQLQNQQAQVAEPRQASPEEEELAAMVSVVLADTEEVWQRLFREQGSNYRVPTLVLFTESVRSACGFQSAATGPFYCPPDQKIYIDLGFYHDMEKKLGAPGDFAQAYVIAHEVGHHVQNLLGISEKVHRQKQTVSEEAGNQLSVRLELQADYFAGVWAHHADQSWDILEEGDIDEALNAASAIGDDRLQKRSQGYAVPETFTHGTSEQRHRWFKKGYQSGSFTAGNTFDIPYSQL